MGNAEFLCPFCGNEKIRINGDTPYGYCAKCCSRGPNADTVESALRSFAFPSFFLNALKYRIEKLAEIKEEAKPVEKQFVSDLNVRTEEAARKSFCPVGTCGNGFCAVRKCMAWRFWTETEGYCGLAGKPDGTKV